MPANVKLVQLDLNNPAFQTSWVSLEIEEAERVRKAFKKILKLSWNDLYRDQGLKWEKVQSLAPPAGFDSLYTFRITQSVRAIGYRDGNFLRVLLIQPDHDATYGKK